MSSAGTDSRRLIQLVAGGSGTPEALILIVEDRTDVRRAQASYLRRAGFGVLEAADGETAVSLAAERQPTLVLMDIGLPLLDGCAATRRIKADARTRHIPVVALSGDSSSATVARAVAAGASRFLAKPCPPDMLVAAMREVLHPARSA